MTKLTLANDGMDLHHQQLLSPQQGMAQDDLIAVLMSGEAGPLPTGLDSVGGVGALNPGLSGSVTLDLAGGNYVMVGFVVSTDVPHRGATPLLILCSQSCSGIMMRIFAKARYAYPYAPHQVTRRIIYSDSKREVSNKW